MPLGDPRNVAPGAYSKDEAAFYVLVCRECDGEAGIPFPTPEARGRWSAEHTRGTGHDHWFVIDLPAGR